MSRHRNETPVGETAPLLGSTQSTEQPVSPSRWWQTVPFRFKNISNARLVPILGTITVFFNESEFYIKQPAFLRAVEALACAEHYTKLNDPIARLGKHIPELMCKEKPIQEYVAQLQGVYYIVRMGSAVLGTFFILSMFKAGRRRPILILHKLNVAVGGLLLIVVYLGYPKIPAWTIVLTGLPGLFGGNFDLGTSTLFASYGDVIADASKRSSLIFITTSLQYLSQAICLPISGRLITLNGQSTPEVSFYISSVFAISILLITTFLYPETYVPEHQQDKAGNERPALDSSGTTQGGRAPSSGDASTSKTQKSSDKSFSILKEDFGMPRVICLLLATFCFLASARMIDWYGVLQYPSIKFNWKVSKTTYLVCMQAVFSFINFAVVLPTVTNLCQRKYKVSARATAVGIAAASALIAAASSVVLGLPDTTPVVFAVAIAVYTLGSGANGALQAYTINTASTPRSSGAALTVISLAATMGKVGAASMWPTLLPLGLEHPSGRLGGLPFFVAAVLFVVVAISIGLADRRSHN